MGLLDSILGVGGGLLGGILGSDAQSDAANAAANASMYGANKSAEVQQYMFDQMMKMNQPYNTTGLMGLSQLTGQNFMAPQTAQPSPVSIPSGAVLVNDPVKGTGYWNETPAQYGAWTADTLPGSLRYLLNTSPPDVPASREWVPASTPSTSTTAPQYTATSGGIDPTGGAGEYMSSLEGLPALSLPSFNFAFNPEDPTYKFRQAEMEKTINQAAAARGNWNSRPTINALAYGNMGLTADETEKQFGRALSSYEADYGRSKDLYSSQYGKLTDLYNMASQLGGVNYNKILDMVKIGQGAAGTAGQGALATGQGLASTYGNLGSSLANTELIKGQTQSDLWSGLGALPMNYMLMNKLLGQG